MNLDRAGDLIWITGALILVGSGLIVRIRQRPGGQMARMAGLWLAIFIALFAIAHWLDGRG